MPRKILGILGIIVLIVLMMSYNTTTPQISSSSDMGDALAKWLLGIPNPKITCENLNTLTGRQVELCFPEGGKNERVVELVLNVLDSLEFIQLGGEGQEGLLFPAELTTHPARIVVLGQGTPATRSATKLVGDTLEAHVYLRGSSPEEEIYSLATETCQVTLVAGPWWLGGTEDILNQEALCNGVGAATMLRWGQVPYEKYYEVSLGTGTRPGYGSFEVYTLTRAQYYLLPDIGLGPQ